MNIDLVNFDVVDLPEWIEVQRTAYVHQRVLAGDDVAAAERNAAQSYETAFPDGRPASGHHVFHLNSAEERVGVAWIGPHPNGVEGVAWIWEIEIAEAHRGRGYGRAAMLALEDRARALGHTAIALNVFGTNTAAQRLYESVGFTTTAVQMRKAL